MIMARTGQPWAQYPQVRHLDWSISASPFLFDEQFVLIVDGAAHKIASPKRKRIKHLECRGDVAKAIAAKLKEGAKVFDAEINSALKSLGYDENR